MTAKTLNVWWDGSFVGQFTQDRHGDISFTYSQSPILKLGLMTRKRFRFQHHSRSGQSNSPAENATRSSAAFCPRRANAKSPPRHWVFHLRTTLRFSTA